jgi:hypothetical protein
MNDPLIVVLPIKNTSVSSVRVPLKGYEEVNRAAADDERRKKHKDNMTRRIIFFI